MAFSVPGHLRPWPRPSSPRAWRRRPWPSPARLQSTRSGEPLPFPAPPAPPVACSSVQAAGRACSGRQPPSEAGPGPATWAPAPCSPVPPLASQVRPSPAPSSCALCSSSLRDQGGHVRSADRPRRKMIVFTRLPSGNYH